MKSSKIETFDRHNYFLLHIATFVLLLLSFLSTRRIIPEPALLLLVVGLSIGFYISWYVADNKEVQKWITLTVNIFALIIAVWLIRALLYTEFLYLPIIETLLKALLVIGLVLSFMLFSSKSYNYIQISSIFLVLGSIAIKKIEFGYQQPAIVILYIFTYVIIMRLRFLIEIKRDIKSFISTKLRNRNIHNLISITFLFLVLLGLSWVLFIRTPKVEPFPHGILPLRLIGPSDVMETPQDTAQRFFDSKQKLSRELNNLADQKQTTTYQKKRLLYFLLELLRKDAPIQKAQEEISKLKEFLMNSDLDLSQAEKSRLIDLADEYMRHKTEYESEQLHKALQEKLLITQLNIGQRSAILRLFRQLQNTSQLSIACYIVEKAHEKIDMQLLLSPLEIEDLTDIFNSMLSVKTNQIIIHIMGSLKNQIKGMGGLSEKERSTLREILSNIETGREISLLREHFKEIKTRLKKLKMQDKISQNENNKVLSRLETLRRAKTLQIASHKEFVTALEEEPRLISSQREHLKEQLAQIKEAPSEGQARDALKEITQQLDKLTREGRLDYASAHRLKQKAEETYQARFPREAMLAQLARDRAAELTPRLEKEFVTVKDPFSSFSDKLKKLNISPVSEQNLKILIKQLQESFTPIHVRQTMKDIENQLESLKELKEISLQEKEALRKKTEILAKIKEELIKASLILPLTEEIESLENITREQKDKLKDDLKQMVSKGDFEDLREKYDQIMNKISEKKLLPKRAQEKQEVRVDLEIEKRKDKEAEEIKQNWEIKIIPSTVLCYVGKPFQLAAIGIYKNFVIHDLTREIIWKSENEDIVYISKEGMLIPLTPGKVKIKAVWLDNISSEAKCTVIQKIPHQEIQWLYDTVSLVPR